LGPTPKKVVAPAEVEVRVGEESRIVIRLKSTAEQNVLEPGGEIVL
jgi:hypothetical protein